MNVYIVTAFDHKNMDHEVIAATMSGAKAHSIGDIAADDLCEEANKGKNPDFPPLAVIQEHDKGFIIVQGEETLHEIQIVKERLL